MQLIFEIFYHTVLESLNAAFDLFIKLRQLSILLLAKIKNMLLKWRIIQSFYFPAHLI